MEGVVVKRSVGRAMAGLTLGAIAGVASGIVARKLKRTFYGLVGGTLAGLVGGLVYEGAQIRLGNTTVEFKAK